MMYRIIHNRWFQVGSLAAVAVLGYLAFAVFGVQALFTNTVVNEDFSVASRSRMPVETVTSPRDLEATAMSMSTPRVSRPTTAPTLTPTVQTALVEPPTAPTVTAPPTMAPTAVPEPTAVPTPAGPVLVSAGSFHAVAHRGSGDALIYQQPDGSYVLRLENLDIFNGPDLYVYAVAAADATNEQDVLNADFINVGRLKGNQGNQTYLLPAEFDPTMHRAISIWCQRFTVNFATAPLN